jgi:hypothetical protein
MSKRFTYLGSKPSTNFFLDLFPNCDYFISLDKGTAAPEPTMITVERGSSGVTQSFTPEEIIDGTLTTFLGSNQGRVSQWQTRGLILRDFNQATTGNRPLIADASGNLFLFNGRPYLDFNGARDISTGNSADRIFRDNCTVFWIYQSQNTLGSGGVFEEQGGSTTFRVVLNSDTRNIGFTHTLYAPQAATGNVTLRFASQQPTNTLRMLAARKTGNFLEGFDENGLVDSSALTVEFPLTTTSFRLGLQTSGTQRFDGYLAEVIVFKDQALSNAELNAVFTHRRTHYGV